MFKANNMIEIGGLAATAINIIQSQSIHESETVHAKRRHDESMALAQMQHEKDLKIAKQTYLMAAFTSLEQHFQQLNADLISSSKESESDMFDQRNQSFQTVILSASVMFSSLSTVIIQGFLPTNADEFLFVSYALTSALSFAFLFLSIVLCIEVILRASSFMYNRARKHTTQLREAIQKTKLMMKRIRGGQFPDEYGGDFDGNRRRGNTPLSSARKKGDSNNNAFFPNGVNGSDVEGEGHAKEKIKVPGEKHKRTFRRQIADMKEEDLQVEWERHEAEVHKYLEEREKINDQTSVLVSADANSSRMSFEQFWRESCKFWADIAILFFYAGTANLLLAIMIYMWAEFFITYKSPVGAVIAVVFIGVSLVVGILLAIYLRQNDNYSRGVKLKKRPSRVNEKEHNSAEDDRETKGRKSRSSSGQVDTNQFNGEEKVELFLPGSYLGNSGASGPNSLYARRNAYGDERNIRRGDGHGSTLNSGSSGIQLNEIRRDNASPSSALTTVVNQNTVQTHHLAQTMPETSSRNSFLPISKRSLTSR